MRKNCAFALIGALAGFASLEAQEDAFELNPLLASAERIQLNQSYSQAAVSKLGIREFELGQFRDIADSLATYPGIASFRRTNSLAAHPTTQGVRLRNFGANASSRALVLFDGVPQNDPFGAWVYWHQYDLTQLDALHIYPSGIAETWGNMASGGLVSMVAKEAAAGARLFQASIGSAESYDLKAYAAYAAGDEAVFDIGIRRFDSDGFHTLAESQRGTVDEAAYSSAAILNTRVSWKPNEAWKSQLSLRLFDEERGNGTPLGRNDTEGLDLSWVAEREIPDQDATLNLSLYLQDRTFRNVFTSVEDDRNSERPALDQYDVPAEALGGALVYRSELDLGLRYAAGVDFRMLEGAVNERYRNLGSGFTRERYAGGEQDFIGLFTQIETELSDRDTLTGTIRLEDLKREEGRRTETDTENGNLLLEEAYADSTRTVLSGNLNWTHKLTENSNTQFALFSGYRSPTLNELYRPFRVRNDITEANPELANERHQGLEISYHHHSADGLSGLRLSGFFYEASEMVANALLTTESGFDPRFGFIPPGGSGSARVNLDRSHVSGIELQAKRQLSQSLRATLTAVYAETEIRNDELEELQGNAFPQSAPWKAVAGLEWKAKDSLTLWTNYRWYDRSWEDLGNTRRLGATADLSLGAHFEIDAQRSLSLHLSNAFDERNVSGIASNGLVTIDEPREFQVTFTWKK
ncbi:TonB-dependent receptor plug domain-containing protein [Pelagicoccus enzymogenes]|uniref:TonB-dependent receptor plug domain-containing protein n=1 Tax=Pelagicoccus enzymogenes TaxID=2773457 RepID=UPI00280D59C9|nr:TonB-dependent receptor [Pelagicoccus enzymogenes]MDQ8199261.1 TonB-dependent receptor plug domain-containing protein [Pelagicoccus enzymogenes]